MNPYIPRGRRVLLAAALCLGLGAFSDPAAHAGSIRLSLLPPAVDELPLGGDLDAAMKWVRGRVEAATGPRLKKALDGSERARIRRRMEERIQEIRRTVVAFDGERTGYEVSVVAGQFLPGARESLLLFRQGGVEHYLFFTHGKLWKYARPLAAEETTFDERYDSFVADHGEPTKRIREEGEGGGVTEARWDGREVRLRLLNRRLMYRADLLVVEDAGIAGRITELRGGKRPEAPEAEVDPDLQDFLE